VKEVTFVGFRGGDRPNSPPASAPAIASRCRNRRKKEVVYGPKVTLPKIALMLGKQTFTSTSFAFARLSSNRLTLLSSNRLSLHCFTIN